MILRCTRRAKRAVGSVARARRVDRASSAPTLRASRDASSAQHGELDTMIIATIIATTLLSLAPADKYVCASDPQIKTKQAKELAAATLTPEAASGRTKVFGACEATDYGSFFWSEVVVTTETTQFLIMTWPVDDAWAPCATYRRAKGASRWTQIGADARCERTGPPQL